MLLIHSNLDNIHQINSETRKNSEKFLLIMREWALHEEFYANGMKRISLSLETTTTNNCTSSLNSLIKTLADKSKEFSSKLSESIVKPFDKFLCTQCKSTKSAYIDGKKIDEFMGELYENAMSSMKSYHSSMHECDSTAQGLDSEASSNKKLKLLKRLIQEQREMKSKFFSFQESFSIYNNTSQRYNNSIKKIVEAYNYFEEKTIELYKTSMEVLQEAFTQRYSVFDNITPETFSVPMHFTYFPIENFKLPEITLEDYIGTHPLFRKTMHGPVTRNFSILETTGLEGLSDFVEDIYRNEIEGIINKAWEGDELSSGDYFDFNSRIKEKVGRKTCVYCLNLKRNKGSFILNDSGYEKIGELIQAVLNECERSKDIEAANNIIILSQTFYRRKEDESKEYLQLRINQHSLWKDLLFWESSINYTIYNELNKTATGDPGQNQEFDIGNCKSLIFCQLVTFGNVMISFFISKKNVTSLIGKYAKQYKFSNNETNEILNAIIDSVTNDLVYS